MGVPLGAGVPKLVGLLLASILRHPSAHAFVYSGRSFHHITNGRALATKVEAENTVKNDLLTFEPLIQMSNRLEDILKDAPSIIGDYYESQLGGFSVNPSAILAQEHLSITSSCYALLALRRTSASSAWNANDFSSDIIPSTLEALLDSKWRQEDMFQVSLLLYTLFKMDPNGSVVVWNDHRRATVSMWIQKVLQARPKRRYGNNQAFSDYIQYLMASSYVFLLQNPGWQGLMSDAESQDIVYLSVSRSAEASWNEVCRQLAYRSAGDYRHFDNVRLAYSLLTYWITSGPRGLAQLPLPSDSTDGVDNSAPYHMPLNEGLAKQALRVFFEEQRPDGLLWDQGQPIYRSFRKQGRNIGNAFVFALDTVGYLLEELPSGYFASHMDGLVQVISWSERQLQTQARNREDQSGLRVVRGWSSPHLREGQEGPSAWATAQVLRCLALLQRRIIGDLLHNIILDEFGGVKLEKSSQAWDRLLDSDVGIGDGESKAPTLKSILAERVLKPFAGGVDRPGVGASYSSILFGPPGTAKTTVCESLAAKMGWDFVVIDTSSFLADGLSNVANRIRYVFKRLCALDECVILFDEIEEFCLDRETPGLSMESRMLTTAMLTAINDLRRTKKSVFFLATNRLRAFDAAIIRPGRFDMQLFVGTPNLDAQLDHLKKALAATDCSTQLQEQVVEAYNEYASKRWGLENDLMFFNFLEGRQLAASIANLASASQSVPTTADLDKLIAQQAAVMTCRRSVRDEYIASVNMSRY